MRHLIILPALLALTAPASAGPREDTRAGISRCAALPDDRSFLDCVYGASQPMRSRLGLPPASEAQQRLVPPAYAASSAPPSAPRVAARLAVPKDNTGVLGNVLGANTTPGWLETYTVDGKGLFTVTLSNGEVSFVFFEFGTFFGFGTHRIWRTVGSHRIRGTCTPARSPAKSD